MHGFSSGSTSLVNAEADYMGGVVDGGVGIGTKPSPRRAAIEKAQAELRLEYDVREERRRELEFLEKGGDPLDFKFGHAVSVSVQSTSHTNRHPDQNLTSEAKGSFALTASPHGDSVESSGRLGVTTTCEPNSADNFDCDNEVLQSDIKPSRPGRDNSTLLERSSQRDKSRNVKNLEDSPNFHPKKSQAYRRRIRTRPNHDDPRSKSTDMTFGGGPGSSMPARLGMLSEPVASENQIEMETDGTHLMHSVTSRVVKLAEGTLNASIRKEKMEVVQNPSSKSDEALVTVGNVDSTIAVGRTSVVTVGADCPPLGTENTECNATSLQLNEASKVDGDDMCTTPDALNNKALVLAKGLYSESSCSHHIVNVGGNGNTDCDLLTLKNVDSNGALKEHILSVGEKSVSKDNKMSSEEHVSNSMESAPCINEAPNPISHQGNGSIKHDHAEADKDKSFLRDEVKDVLHVVGDEKYDATEIKSEKEIGRVDDCGPEMENSCPVRPLVDPASEDFKKTGFSVDSSMLETLPCTENQSKPLDKAQEDRILDEARLIAAKRKRIAALSVGLIPREHRQKCHWDLVLEEMSWLANDFAQERLWKLTAAAQTCRRVAFASRVRLEEQSKFSIQKSVSKTMVKAVMEFWNSARLSIEKADNSQLDKSKLEASMGTNDMDIKASSDMLQSTQRKRDHAVCGYAVRFLQFNCSSKSLIEIEVPRVSDVACDIGLPELPWEDQYSEENLFYAIPPGALEMYRKSVESCLEECERIGNSTQEEVVTSTHTTAAGCEYEDNSYEATEGENLYYQHGALHTGKPSKKKLKIKSYAARSYKFGGDFGYGNCEETRTGHPQLNVMGKRPANDLHVDPIPIKRMRTASRQRVVGPLGAGLVGVTPVLSKADASSEDTNSFQDDHNNLHGGSVGPRGLEVDSTMNYENQSTFDSTEKSSKPKKKKKNKHQSITYDQRWQLDSSMQIEQNDLMRKRSINQQLESNGNSSLFGQHAKKPKLAKHSLENSFDNATIMSGSAVSPVASQMSNMSCQNKLIKFIGGRDRGKKGKVLKVSNGQLSSGSPWTIVEDQALVVLVHDMGPNWELVSDAINSILQFKCIFRKPHECKDRHKFLMDRPSGDGADSGEDSGSSQPYPSTLPGIPKGSARQLFRSLHAHVEEDNIKSRFEKIILIEQQLYLRKKKNDGQDLKQIAPAHSSHVLSLSQVIPNNVNGGVLTPLDLSDTAISNQESLSADGLPQSNQSSTPVMNSTTGINTSLQNHQGSQGMAVATNLASPPQLTSPRDARYSVPRPIEEQQRLHQYNSMVSGRNVQASNVSSSGALSSSDRGVRMHPGGNGSSMVPGMNRSLPMARPGVQGTPTSMLNPANMGGTSSNMNMHSGRGNGITVFRPRDSLHGVRSSQSLEHPRPMALPGVPPFGGLSPGFSNNQATSHLQTYPGHQNSHVLSGPHSNLSTSNHGATPEQQAYIRISRERQMQQRMLHQQHQQQQHPMASPSSSQPVPLPSLAPSSPMTHAGLVPHQQQKNMQGVGRSAHSGPGGTINQGGKQRQGQGQAHQHQHQQSGRQHPQQRQQAQSQQASKLVKGMGRGNMIVHQNLPNDPSHLNGINLASSANQVTEEAYTGSMLNTQIPSKHLVTPPTKPIQHISSQSDSVNQGKVLGSKQGPSSAVVLSRNRQQLHGKPSLKMVNQSQASLQRLSQHSRHANSDSLTKFHVDHSLTEHKSSSMGPPPACIDSVSNVGEKGRDSVCDPSMTSDSSLLGPSTSQGVTNSLGAEPFLLGSQGPVVEKQSSGSNLISHELESQWQQQESQLLQKQSQIQGGLT